MPKPILTTEMLKQQDYHKDTIQLFQRHYSNGITKWNLEEQIKLLKTPLRKYLGLFWKDDLLENISMKGVTFYKAYLYRANLEEADLRKANFTGVNLRGANITGAIFKDTKI